MWGLDWALTSKSARYGSRPNSRRGRIPPAEVVVRPRQEILPVGRVRMSAVVLAPRKVSVEQSDVHGRHLLLRVVVGDTERLGAEQAKGGLRGDGCHVAALVIEPLRVAAFGDSVAHEREAWSAE